MKQGIVLGLVFLSSCAIFNGRSTQWAQDDYNNQNARKSSFIHRAIQTRDLVVGMNIRDVQEAWGEPQQVERSYEYDSDAERWVYVDGLSAPGYSSLSPKRVIYFEKGEVVGWERLR